jgi:hypothetical protein
MSQRNNQTWGIDGYEVPKIDFDHIKHAKDTEHFLVASGKKKPSRGVLDMKAQRGGLFRDVEKRANSVPAPWNYEQDLKWGSGPNAGLKTPVPSKTFQKVKYLWKNVPKENQAFEEMPKRNQEKLNTTIKKKTFIDEIFIQNTKENYPKPGPSDYFLDSIAIKKFKSDHGELYEKKGGAEETRKDCMK